MGTNVIKDENLVTTNDRGHVVMAPSYGEFDENANFKGVLITASGVDTDTFVDLKLDTQIYLNGGYLWNDGGAIGDYIELSVIDKDDLLGYFSMFGLEQGVDVLELGKYVETFYINPNGFNNTHLHTNDIAPVVSGLYMRLKVHTTSEEVLNVGATYYWFEE